LQDFLRNNRGINDGGDLDAEFMESLYDRIITNEIKMEDRIGQSAAASQQQASSGWLDTIMNLIPGRQKLAADEPNEESIRRTHAHLRYADRRAGIGSHCRSPPRAAL
jgi:brefeldin A-inhibited guanine nucleotide-exchange protein